VARVTVVGGGFSGMAVAARLAKLGHEVHLVERADALGGALASETRDGFTWEAGPSTTILPAVVRDLFRKSGRPLERELDLQPLDLVREHRFDDGTRLALPGGSRAAQLAAFDALSPGLGRQWVDHVASFSEPWELLRKEWYERAWDPDVEPRELKSLLATRTSLHALLRRAFSDQRARQVAAHGVIAAGHDPRKVPGWAGLTVHLEQRFGTWALPQGFSALGETLAARLATRKVTVTTGTEVSDLVVRDGRVVAVRTPAGDLDSEVVVVAIDPHRLPALARHVRRITSTSPPTTVHLGLADGAPDLPHEVVLHGDPLLVLRTTGRAPEGGAAWTVQARGTVHGDLLDLLAARGIDVRNRVVTRIDLSPQDLLARWGGSPQGVLWQGARTAHARLGPRTPIDGVLAVGSHATTGAGLPFVGLTAAVAADLVGRART
jgi:phytoene dehydrogenase-like protein